MKNHLALDIIVEQFMLVINTICREHFTGSGFLQSKDDLPNQCSFSYITAFSCFDLCICPTALPWIPFPPPFFLPPTSVTARQALPYLTHVNVIGQNDPCDSQISV